MNINEASETAPLSTRELHELASLDVLGLLDDDERAGFERAFRTATPEIQAQIRADQVRFADIDQLLPSVDPPVGLKARVLDAVREVISAASEPIASIGASPAMAMRSSAPIWRAACIGFATASMVLAGFAWKVNADSRTLTAAFQSNKISDELVKNVAPGFTRMLTKPSMQHVAFAPVAADLGKAAAALFVDADTKTAYLVCDGLPIAGGQYKLVIKDPSGQPAATHPFQANSGNFFIYIPNVDTNSLNSMQIYAPSPSGGVAEPLLESKGA